MRSAAAIVAPGRPTHLVAVGARHRVAVVAVGDQHVVGADDGGDPFDAGRVADPLDHVRDAGVVEASDLFAGLTWQLPQDWSLSPEVLYLRDRGNIDSNHYSSTEVSLSLRKDF